MAIRPITFANCSVTAKDHGTLFHTIFADGRLNGGVSSASGNVIAVQSGYFLICGRLIELTSTQTFQCENVDQFAQVVMSVSEGGDISMETRYASTSTGFQELIQNDINSSGQLYEVEVCAAHIIPDGQSAVIRSLPYLRHQIHVSDTEPLNWADGDLWFVKAATP